MRRRGCTHRSWNLCAALIRLSWAARGLMAALLGTRGRQSGEHAPTWNLRQSTRLRPRSTVHTGLSSRARAWGHVRPHSATRREGPGRGGRAQKTRESWADT